MMLRATDATLLNVTCCVRLHTLLRVVGSCCAKFESSQIFSYVQTDTTTPNNIESCWPTKVTSVCTGLELFR